MQEKNIIKKLNPKELNDESNININELKKKHDSLIEEKVNPYKFLDLTANINVEQRLDRLQKNKTKAKINISQSKNRKKIIYERRRRSEF